MKGLIRNNFYSMESNLIISFIMATALVFMPLFIKNIMIYPVIIAVQIFLFVVNTGTALHADNVAKWDKFELTLPIKRCMIIGAKYITFMLLILLGLVMGLCTTICIYFLGNHGVLSLYFGGMNMV